MSKKIIFMGTPAFALPALEKLIASEHKVIAVYTAPPKPAGRGKEIKNTAVHELALKHNIPVFTPASLKAEQLPQADIAVVAAYGILLPEHILKGPKFGCINIHPSLLPRWRGAAPIQRTIMAGDTQSAVCIMQMDKGLDTGDILMQENFALPAKITAGELHDKCASLGAELTLRVINNIESLKPKKQSADGDTYAKKITKEDEIINWNEPAETIEYQIRALNPFPGAYFMLDGKKLKVFEADVTSSHPALDAGSKTPQQVRGVQPGEVLDNKLLIACGKDAIRITKLQKEGKKPMTAQEFLNGASLPKGSKLN
jgi:methionyl-tRNA formyltransferase